MASSSRFELQPVSVKLARPSSAPALTAMLTRKLSTNELLTPTLFNQHPRAQLLGIVPSSPSLGAFNGHRALRASLTRASKALNHGQPAFSLLDHATAGSQLVLEATRPGHQTAARPAAALPRATTAEQPPDDEAKASSAVKLATRIYYEGCLLHEPMPVLLPTIVRLLSALPLLRGVSEADIAALAGMAVIRVGDRYQRLYCEGNALQTDGGDIHVVLHGTLECSPGATLELQKGDHAMKVQAADCAGAEMLACPVEARPLLARSHTALWATNGVELTLPFRAIDALTLDANVLRCLETTLCAQLLAPLLPDKFARVPPTAAVAQLASAARLVWREPGELLFRRGTRPESLLFLVGGAVEIRPVAPDYPTIRRELGPLCASELLSNGQYSVDASVSSSHSALLVEVPGIEAINILSSQTVLRQCIASHDVRLKLADSTSAPFQRALPKPDTAPHTARGGSASAPALIRPASAGPAANAQLVLDTAQTTPDWWHSRGEAKKRVALLETASSRKGEDAEMPWTYVISKAR